MRKKQSFSLFHKRTPNKMQIEGVLSNGHFSLSWSGTSKYLIVAKRTYILQFILYWEKFQENTATSSSPPEKKE